MSDTMRLFANCYTFRAIFSFTSLVRTFNLTFGFFAFNVTYRISWFLTACMTSWRSFNYYFYSHTGSHIAGHLGSSHFQAHYGWQWGSAVNFSVNIYNEISPRIINFFILYNKIRNNYILCENHIIILDIL